MAACMFTIIRQSMSIVACHDKGKMDNTLRKVWHALAFLDNETGGGMHKNKQLKNTFFLFTNYTKFDNIDLCDYFCFFETERGLFCERNH